MTQTARPMADDFAGQWTPVPLFPQVDGVSPNDGGPITSGTNPVGDACQVKLSGVAWPGPGGPEVLTVRMMGDSATQATVLLLQGAQVIAAGRFVPGPSFLDCMLMLTAAQIAQIDDYTDLHVRVIAGDVLTTCCPGQPVRPILTATVTGGGACNGSYPMIYDSSLQEWETSAAIGTCVGAPALGTLVLSCAPTNAWQLGTNEPGLVPALYAPSSVSCASPFQLVFSNVDLTGCGGTASATVSVTV